MNKKIITSISLIILILIPMIIFYYFKDNLIKKTWSKSELSQDIQNETDIILDENDIDITHENEFKNLNPHDKIANLRKTFFIKWLIAKWDNYNSTNAPLLALNQYLKAYANNSDNKEVILKIAQTYYELKNYKKSLDFYDKIKNNLSGKNLEDYILVNFYNINQKDKKSYDLVYKNINEIKKLDDKNKFYYLNSLSCLEDFHLCKKNYQSFLDKNDDPGEKMMNIKNAMDNYNAFKSENLYYKDSLIIAEIFKDKLYPVSNLLWIWLLKNKPNYKPILLIIWKWYYEIWDLENSKKYLETYYKLEPKDSNIPYLLWELAFKSRDYSTSNLYYTAALKNWFKNTIDLKRKIVYNYYVIWEKKQLYKAFDELIQEEKSNIDDYSLTIYNYINDNNPSKALLIINKWISRFNETNWVEILYGYLWWIYRENNDEQKAYEYLEKWLKINPNHPLLTLNMWYLLFSKKEYIKASIYFKKTINMTNDWEFFNLATKKLEEIEKLK